MANLSSTGTPSSSTSHCFHQSFLTSSSCSLSLLCAWKKPNADHRHRLHYRPPPSLRLPPSSSPTPRTHRNPRVSLQDPSPQTTPNPHQAIESSPTAVADKHAAAPVKYNSVWVNPNSPRASRLRQQSLDTRYARLVRLAESLNSCNPIETDVYENLALLGDNPSEQDAVVVLNNMENSETALLALEWFRKEIEINREVILYNVTLKVLRKCRNWDGAESLLQEMLENGVNPDNVTFSTLISCARLCNLPDKAVEWFERMPEFDCSPDFVTYSAMIDAYGRSGKVDQALEIYDRARREKWRLDPVTFSTVIKVYSVSCNFDGALNVYEEMKALGLKPNLITYNTLLDAMGRAGRPWQVKAIYGEMGTSGVLPNRATYAALLRAYGRARYPEDALAVYGEMKEKGMELNVVLYNTLLAMCADVGYVDEALKIFEEMKGSPNGCKPDSWTFSSMITIYSCSGKVSEAEVILNEMLAAGFEPNIFVLTSLIQCYGKAKRTDDVVRTFNRLLQLGISPDDRFCGCLLNVITQTPKEEIEKVIGCIDRASPKLGSLVKQLVDQKTVNGVFTQEAEEVFNHVSKEVMKAYCNCLIDLCVNLNLWERACILLDLALRLEIYTGLQSKTSTQWSLHVKSLSLGAALTALYVWMNDLTKALQNGEDMPPLLGIHTGHGKHKYSDKGLASVFESRLRELNSPFHEAPDKVGWFLTTKVAAQSWLKSRESVELVAA